MKINWSSVNCSSCGSPIANDQLSRGQRANAISALGMRLVEARSTKRAKKETWTIPPAVLDVMVELASLGASVDADGFVVSEV